MQINKNDGYFMKHKNNYKKLELISCYFNRKFTNYIVKNNYFNFKTKIMSKPSLYILLKLKK